MTVTQFLNAIEDPEKRKTSKLLHKWLREATGEKAQLHSKNTIVGYGIYHYRYESGRSGSAFRIGFSPRVNGMSIYLMSDFEGEADLLSQMGKHKMGVCCLTFNKLSDLDETILKQLLQKSAKGKICSEVKS